MQTENRTRRASRQAHQRAWAAAEGCENTLIFEEDAFFEESTAAIGMAVVEKYLRARRDYDMILLGWAPDQPDDFHSAPRAAKVKGHHCAYQIRHWSQMQ